MCINMIIIFDMDSTQGIVSLKVQKNFKLVRFKVECYDFCLFVDLSLKCQKSLWLKYILWDFWVILNCILYVFLAPVSLKYYRNTSTYFSKDGLNNNSLSHLSGMLQVGEYFFLSYMVMDQWRLVSKTKWTIKSWKILVKMRILTKILYISVIFTKIKKYMKA